MSKLVIFGNGKIADVAYYYFKTDSSHEIAAFTVDRRFLQETSWHGLPVVPFDEVEKDFPPSSHEMFVAIGYQQLNRLRAGKCEEVRRKGYTLASFFSSRASNPAVAAIGPNTMVLENVAIQPGASVGWNTFLWSGNHIGHHARIGDHCYIAGQVVVSGRATIEPFCFVGVNATIGHEITVGEESLIGAGCLITKSTPPRSVYVSPDTPRYRLDSASFLRLTKMK